MDFKLEFETETFLARCSTCLSFGRKLYPLGDYTDMYQTLMGPFYTLPELSALTVCWECKAMLRKATMFQLRAQSAAILLTQGYESNSKSLSNLTNVFIKEYSLLLYSESDKDEATYLETKITDEEDNYFAQNNDFSDDTEWKSEPHDTEQKLKIKLESEQIILESEEIKLESTGSGFEKEKKTQDWMIERRKEKKMQKCRLLNVKYATQKQMYNKIRINADEVQTYMELERSSEYFKKRHYKCEDCVIGFNIKKQFVKHNEKRHLKAIGKIVCDICKTRFRAKFYLTKHLQSHYYKYVCQHCPYECFGPRNQVSHYRAKHARVVQCLRCDLTFINQTEFHKHYREWHTKFICNECGYACQMRYTLISHIRAHHPERPTRVQCSICTKTFKNRHTYSSHKKLLHPPEAEVAYCVECDMHFRNQSYYKGHIARKHTRSKSDPKTRRHPCPSCNKTFSKNIYMKNHHEYVHLKIYKHICEPCGKKFMRPSQLKVHNRSVHQGIPPPKNKLCYICGRGFSCNKILANHIRVHTGERPFECSHCAARFTQSSALVTHTRNVHGKHKAANDSLS